MRVWSAACSTGEEPYSLAICLEENRLRLSQWELEILGTDISAEVLNLAKAGRYKDRALQEVDEKRRRRYFSERNEEPRWQVRDTVKRLVTIQRHNLMERLAAEPFDCIFIRNVLIYFDRTSKQVVLNNLLRALAVGGYLVVGPSEGVYDMLDQLHKISPLIYQKVGDM